VRESPPTVSVDLPDRLRGAVQAKLDLAREQNVQGRLRDSDATLWGAAGTPEIANRLGWLTIAQRMLGELEAITTLVGEVRAEGIRDVVLLGMGGSSLAPEVLWSCFGPIEDRPVLHVLDSTDASRIRSVERAIDPQRTLFVVSSKSGGTIEPLSLFAHFFSVIGEGSHFVAITDPGSGLEELAEQHGFRRVFAGDPDIGGRYSALSAFGIVPAALMGIDVRGLLEGATGAWLTAVSEEEELGAGVWLGAALSALAQAGRDKLTFVVAETLPSIGLWLEQLVAESTGKHATGILPVADEPLGDPDLYGDDRVFAYLPDLGAPDEELDRRIRSLAEAGHPVLTLPTEGPADLGRLFLLSEIAAAVAGWGLSINPFDQPNVQQAKDATNRVLAGYETERELPAIADADTAALRALLGGSAPPSYVAIMGYLEPSPEFDAAIAELRVLLRQATHVTTTFGYGPRFLHSTGQFHKGGPRTGRFLQLVHDGPEDVEIPGKPFTFTTLKNAQAIGDLQTLRELSLPAERVRLGGPDPLSGVRELNRQIKEML